MSCYCHTCKRRFHRLGIARHRAMHRHRREDCEITYAHGDVCIHEFSKRLKPTTSEKGSGYAGERKKQEKMSS